MDLLDEDLRCLAPARTIGERAVDDDDILNLCGLRCEGDDTGDEGEYEGREGVAVYEFDCCRLRVISVGEVRFQPKVKA